MLTAMLVTSAATLIESVPFVLAGAALQMLPFRWNARLVPYLGCGCGVGPSARSLPAAAATWIVFGPIVAALRVFAATIVDGFIQKRRGCAHEDASVLSQLALIAPMAGLGAGFSLFAGAVFSQHMRAASAFAAGAALGFALAPCGLGAVGLAAAMRASAPPVAAGFLCIAGIVDLRSWLRVKRHHAHHDMLSYALTGIVCALVALRGGGSIVHPTLALALWPCAAACFVLAYRYRTETHRALRIAPAIMLVGAVLSAPPPAYHATETTLADAFPGEHIDFTGILTRTGNASTLVRYAITCCRADAAPIVIRLEQNVPKTLNGWAHARGVLVTTDSGLKLRTSALTRISAPADPFVYR